MNFKIYDDLKLDETNTYPKGFYTNFAGHELLQYEKALAYLNDSTIELRWGQTYCSKRGRVVADADRHSIWFTEEPYRYLNDIALTLVLNALRVKRVMPPHGVGRYQNELRQHIGSLMFKMDVDVWAKKHNHEMSGYGPSSLLFCYPTEWHGVISRLAEVMNEPGNGAEVFVLVLDNNEWCVCRDQGRETVARFPCTYTNRFDICIDSVDIALRVINHLNRGNSYIPVPPREVSLWQQWKQEMRDVTMNLLLSYQNHEKYG